MPDTEATLATQVYRRLRNDLLEGRLLPGAKLKVQNIAAEYGVGASPIREALSSLAAEGLVDRLDQRGFRAAPATIAEFEELVRARCWLEETVLRESIAAGGHDWEETLVLANYRLGRTERSGVTQTDREWDDAHEAYHNALLGACPSPTLLGFCATLRERANRYRNIAKTVSYPPRDVAAKAAAYPSRDVAAEHEAITKAALARRADEACERLVEHYTITAKYLRLALEQQQEEAEELAEELAS